MPPTNRGDLESSLTSKLYAILCDLQPHSGEELDRKLTWRFGAAINTLRDEGYDIVTGIATQPGDLISTETYQLTSLTPGPIREPHARIDLTLNQARWLNGLVKANELLGMHWFAGISDKIGAALANAEKEWERRKKKGNTP
jgi:hypothetical protein